MKKVLLVTLQGDNIGNRLQNYALQTILESNGCDVWTPYCDMNEFELTRSKIKFSIEAFLGFTGIQKYRKFYFRRLRIKRYKSFNEQHISNMFKLDYDAAFEKNWSDFDFAVTGSDQVWHRWSVNPKELLYFYLQFIEAKKRIAYAASFGFASVPENDVEIHKKCLKEIESISCREQKGAEIVKNLTGKNVLQVLDPTLLLDRQGWEKIEAKPKWVKNNKYVLTYFLDKTKPGYLPIVENFACDNGLQLVNAFDVDDINSQLITPDEFIWLVHHAEYVCTDSFHATVFSIIFEKKFLSFKRRDPGMDKMFDRIESLLNLFRVSERVFKGPIDAIKNEYILNDISQERENSLKFLRESLGIKDE